MHRSSRRARRAGSLAVFVLFFFGVYVRVTEASDCNSKTAVQISTALFRALKKTPCIWSVSMEHEPLYCMVTIDLICNF